jgi:hypothetical protein
MENRRENLRRSEIHYNNLLLFLFKAVDKKVITEIELLELINGNVLLEQFKTIAKKFNYDYAK